MLEKHLQLLNILQLGFALMLMMAAFFTQGLIEEVVINSVALERSASNVTGNEISEHAGYYSLAIIYAVFTISNFIAPPLIGLISAKWSMVIGSTFYCLFMAAFFKLNAAFLYFTSGLLGLGGALLWTGQGNYLTINSSSDTIGRNSGILYAMIQSCLIYGGIFLFFIFRSIKNLDEPSIRTLYTWFLAICGGGVISLALLRSPRKESANPRTQIESEVLHPLTVIPVRQEENGTSVDLSDHKRTPCNCKWTAIIEDFTCTFKLLKTRNMQLLCVVFLYTGLKLTFWTGVYSTCLAFTTKLSGDGDDNSILAFNALALGCGQMLVSGAFGLLGNPTALVGQRSSIVFFGMVIHLICYGLIFINIPMEAPLHKTDQIAWIEPNYWLALLCAFLLGFGDSCYVTQVYSLLGSVYSENSSSAFALYNTFQSIAACGSFLYGAVLYLHWQLLILSLGTILAATCFFPVERYAQKIQHDAKMKMTL